MTDWPLSADATRPAPAHRPPPRRAHPHGGRPARAAAAALMATLGCGAAVAQGPAQRLLDSPLVVQAGGFLVLSGIEANVNGQSTQNPEINFDDAFGRGRTAARGRLGGLWRITPTHQLQAQYFDSRNSRTSTLREDVPFGDFVFLANGSATFSDESQVLQVAYSYAWRPSPPLEIAATAGLHATNISLQVSGTARVLDAAGNVVSTSAASRKAEALAPMPVLGVRAGWAVAPNWLLEGHLQVFSLKLKEARGSWSNLRVGATWMVNDRLGLGIGYDRFGTRLEVDKPDFDGRVRLGYQGIQAYLTGAF